MIIIKSKMFLTKMAEEQIIKNILEQKASGVIVLQPYLEAFVFDDDTKLEFKFNKEPEWNFEPTFHEGIVKDMAEKFRREPILAKKYKYSGALMRSANASEERQAEDDEEEQNNDRERSS